MTDAVTAFIERLGLVVEEHGLPRTAGRMIGLFLVNEGPRSLDDIATVLQVSKASVSTNARLLERRGMLVRTSSPGDRRDYYQMSENCWEQMFEVGWRRMQQVHRVLAEGLASLPDELASARARVREAQLFYGFLLETDLEGKIEEWRGYRASKGRTGAAGGDASSEGE